MDAIKMVGIVKCFGPVRANDGIDFTVKHQEIHCLLGGERNRQKHLDEYPFRVVSSGCGRDLH